MCWGKDKPDLQSSITKKAQELKTQQKRVIDKTFQEKQKEKYEARLEFQRKTLEVQQWKKKHNENLLRVTISVKQKNFKMNGHGKSVEAEQFLNKLTYGLGKRLAS